MTATDRLTDDDGELLIPVWAAPPLQKPGAAHRINAPGREQRCPEDVGGCGRTVTVASTGYINAHSSGRIKQTRATPGSNLRADNQCPLSGELWRDVATLAVAKRQTNEAG